MTSVFQRRILRPLHCDENLRPRIPARIILSDHLSVSVSADDPARTLGRVPLLADFTTLRLGGPARRLVVADDEDAIVAAVRAADAAAEPLLVLAGGSNLVVADAGFPGTVLRIASRGVRADGDRLTVAAGEPWDPFVADCVAAGRAGVECLSGIPGSVGATPIQNVGAYGQEVAETVVSVRAYDRDAGAVEEIPAADCGFAYRSSVFKRTPGPLGRARGDLRAAARAPTRPRSATPSWPARSAWPRGRPRRSPTCAAPCSACAAARAWSSTRPTRTPSRRARSSPTPCSTRMRSPRSRRARPSGSDPTRASRASRSPTAP